MSKQGFSERWPLIAVSVFFLLCSLSVPWRSLDYGCISAYDLGIFSQTLLGAWHGHFDPFVSLRELFASQDHWDPIVQILSIPLWPVQFLFSAPRTLLILETSLVLGAAWYLRQGMLARGFKRPRANLGFLLVLWTPMIWAALRFPVHPTTWALVGHVGLLFWFWDAFQEDQRPWWLVRGLIWGLLVSCCGEQFSISWWSGAVALFVLNPARRKQVVPVIVVASLAVWWTMRGRIFLHGSIFDYSTRLTLEPLKLWSLYRLDGQFFHRIFDAVLSLIAPALILLAWTKSSARRDLLFFLTGLAFLGPLVLGRLLAVNWGSHYGVVWVAVAVLICLMNPAFELSKRQLRWSLALLFLSSISGWGLAFHFVQTPAPGCDATNGNPTDTDWSTRKDEMQRFVQSLPAGAKLVGNIFVMTSVLDQRPDVDCHLLGHYRMEDRARPIDLVVTSETPFGNAWPMQDQAVQALREKLKSPRTEAWKTLTRYPGPWPVEMLDEFTSLQSMRTLGGHAIQ